MRLRFAGFLAALPLATAAPAGPPYVTDDPEPTDLGKWEVYGYTAGSHAFGETEGEAGFDINYGAAPDLQLSTVITGDYQRADGHTQAGFADTEIGAKYKFIHQHDGSPIPDVSFYPTVMLPTAGKRFGSGKVGVELPIWMQKDIGRWSLFGGGAYTFNPGIGNRNFWFTGVALQRQVSEHVAIGGEVYHQARDADDGHAQTGFGLGGSVDVAKEWALIASGGPLLQADGQHGYAFYLGLSFRN